VAEPTLSRIATDGGQRPSWLDVVAAGVTVALAGGFLEVGVHLFRRYVKGGFSWMGVDVAWMAPAYALIVAAPIIAAVLVVRAIKPRLASWELAAGAPAAVAFFSLSFVVIHNTIHPLALAVLASGAGIAGGRLAARNSFKARTVVRSAAIACFTLLVLVAGGVPLWYGAREARALANLPSLPPGTPNVLLIILDTVRAASMSVYGYGRPTTPKLSRWAERGVVFERAYSTAPWTLPSHASLLTGLWPQEFDADWEHSLSGGARTITEVMAGHGFATVGIVANQFYVSRESGLAQGFHHYSAYLRNKAQLRLSTGFAQWWEEHRNNSSPAKWTNFRKPASTVSRGLLEWVDEHPGTPFFGFLNYFDAHLPYRPLPTWPVRTETTERSRDRYDGSIAALDGALDSLFTELDRRRILERTIVIITSDHGELFGEHGLVQHGNALYRELLEVPLVVWGPGIPGGQRVTTPVTLRDIPATIADLSRIGATGMPGKSLAAFWRSGSAISSPVFARVTRHRRTPPELPIFHGTMTSVIEGNLHYIRRGDGNEELFDLAVDPREGQNLARVSVHQQSLARLRELSRRLHGTGS
jgi:arylsulfatase A-like enzyme